MPFKLRVPTTEYISAVNRAPVAAARAGGTCGPTGSSVGWVVGSVRRRGLTPAALVEPVALAIHLEDVDVVGEAVEESAGKLLGAEHLGPFVEGQIGGDQGRAPLVALAEHLEQEIGTNRTYKVRPSLVLRTPIRIGHENLGSSRYLAWITCTLGTEMLYSNGPSRHLFHGASKS